MYIDEFQNFTTEAFGAALSETRKYGLTLSLFHQYTAQLPDTLRAAVFGNVGSIISFRVGEQDARILERELDGEIRAAEFTALENHQVCVKLIENGIPTTPFKARTLQPAFRRINRRSNLVRQSRQKFCRDRRTVESRISKWMGQ